MRNAPPLTPIVAGSYSIGNTLGVNAKRASSFTQHLNETRQILSDPPLIARILVNEGFDHPHKTFTKIDKIVKSKILYIFRHG